MNATFLFAALLLSFPAALQAGIETLRGPDLVRSRPIEIKPGARGTVVVFLSAKCPCSDSHVQEVKSLSQEHAGFNFVAVHSNVDEDRDTAAAYFKKASLPFPVIRDEGARIADEFKAFKTPHAYVLSAEGEILYKGGVSNSKDCDKADRKFLREALDDLKAGRTVKTPEGRTLGCVISRGEKNEW